MSEPIPTVGELLRKALFVPCRTQETLHQWIEVYLGLDIPDTLVDPDSTCSPMGLIWEIYSKALSNEEHDFQRILAYAARDSFKTLGAAVLEVLAIVHLERDVAHMAAIEQQAAKAQSYVKAFFDRPILQDYITSDNKRKMDFVRYYNTRTGDNLTEKQFKALSELEQRDFEKKAHYISIILCTMQSTNSEHVPFFVIDEVDVIPTQHLKAYEEAKAIPCTRDGKLPITLLISTRKFSFGKVQQEIDDAATTIDDGSGLHVRHWNLMDVTERCPTWRHKPEEPKVSIYYSDETLKSISEEQYLKLDPEQKSKAKYKKTAGYAGCLKCRLFAQCQGRLATGSKPYVRGSLLKPIADTIQKFRSSAVSFALAQYLCRKPSTEGLIYPSLERELHMLTAAQMASKITGEEYPETFNRDSLVQLLRQREVRFVAGIDYGYTHNFAVPLIALDGNRAFIIGAWSQAELDPAQKIELLDSKIKSFDPVIYADTEAPDMNKLLKKKGYRVKDWKKTPGSVLGGIEIVRYKLAPSIGDPEMFFLAGDEGVEFFFKRLSQYHWALDASGRPSNIPDDTDDDECFTGDTEAFTKRGWVSLREIAPTDEVWSVSSEGEGAWEVPSSVIHKQYSGGMYRISHHHLDFDATEGHSHAVMTQQSWKIDKRYWLQKRTVDEMCSEMYWANNCRWPVGPGAFVGDDEAWVAGFWIAEGCFDTHRPTYIIMDQTKQPQKDILRSRLLSLGWRWSETVNGEAVRFTVSGQGDRASSWRRMFGSGAENKKIGIDLLLRMSQSEREALWDGYMSGDGSRSSAWHFDSVSKTLIEDVQILTMMLGYGCRIVSYNCMRAGRTTITPNGHLSSNTLQSYRGHVLQRRAVAHISKTRFKKYDAKDLMVHCVRVSTGQFLARTNGKPFVAGNCDSIRYPIMNLFKVKGRVMAAEERDEYRPTLAAAQTGGGSVPQGVYGQNDWAKRVLQDYLQSDSTPGQDDAEQEVKGKRGGFIWDLG